MNIVFMGTPEFAVPSLKACVKNFHVSAVFCQPDRPKGRSKRPVPCAVKVAALELGIPVFQPEKASSSDTIENIQKLKPDFLVVAAYGQILPQKLLDIPHNAPINVHASILPRWRGASPIHMAIKEGDKESGVSIMRMVKKLDAGPVYLKKSTPIGKKGRLILEQELAEIGAELLVTYLSTPSQFPEIEQDPELVTYAPIIKKGMGFVTLESAEAAVRTIKAFEDWPGVWLAFRGEPVRIIEASVSRLDHKLPAGSHVVLSKKEIRIACEDGTVLQIEKLQPRGKKPQLAVDFINGHRPKADEVWETLKKDPSH